MKISGRNSKIRSQILDKLNNLCKENNITLCEMCSRLNLSMGTVYQWRSEPKRLPSLASILDVCELFNVTLSEFFTANESEAQSEEEKKVLADMRRLTPEVRKNFIKLLTTIAEETERTDRTRVEDYDAVSG